MDKRVLLVDADTAFAERIAEALSPEGFAVVAVPDGDRALARARDTAPAALILGSAANRALLREELSAVDALGDVPVLLLGDDPGELPDAWIERDADPALLALRLRQLIDTSLPAGDEPLGSVRRMLQGDEERARLEAELFSVKAELGARIAELEGEVEALRLEDQARLKELASLHAEAGNRAPEKPVLVKMLHAELEASQAEREAALAELEAVKRDREKLQDDLASQIAQLASSLAQKEAEGRALEARLEKLQQALRESEEARARLSVDLEDLKAENEFLDAEMSRLATRKAE